MTRNSSRILVGSFFASLWAVLLFAGLMLHTETTIPVPEANQEILLQRLIYKARFEAKVTSVRIVPRSESDVDPLVADWVFAGSNSDGQVHRLEMQIRLLDGAGKQIGFFVAKHPLAAGAHDQKFSVPMKVELRVWRATETVRIFADWIV